MAVSIQVQNPFILATEMYKASNKTSRHTTKGIFNKHKSLHFRQFPHISGSGKFKVQMTILKNGHKNLSFYVEDIFM